LEGELGNCVWEDEKGSGDVGDSCTTVGMYVMLPNCILEDGKTSKFYVYFTTITPHAQVFA